MKIGLVYTNWAAPDDASAFAVRAEALGFESLWTTEHVVVPKGYDSTYPYSRRGKMAGGQEDFPSPDPLVWLAFAGAATQRIGLATGILVLPQRNPLVLAKEVATLDRLSGGRVTLGVGVGWLEEEFVALGVPFERRGERTDEYVTVLRTLWQEELASFHGEFIDFDEVYMRPLPEREIPIVIGGHSPRAARRAGELGDGFFPAGIPVDGLSDLVDQARGWAERAERDPAALEITYGVRPTVEDVEKAMGAGVDRILVPVPPGVEGVEMVASALGGLLSTESG